MGMDGKRCWDGERIVREGERVRERGDRGRVGKGERETQNRKGNQHNRLRHREKENENHAPGRDWMSVVGCRSGRN